MFKTNEFGVDYSASELELQGVHTEVCTRATIHYPFLDKKQWLHLDFRCALEEHSAREDLWVEIAEDKAPELSGAHGSCVS